MELFRGLAAAGAVLTLLAATLWLLKRHGLAYVSGRSRTVRRLECMERLSLGPQHTLHLVRMGDTALLLASTPAGCALVRTLPCRELEGSREVAS